MKKILVLLFIAACTCSYTFADSIAINHFIVKENPFGKDEIALVATDSLNNILENLSGKFTFTINGFQEELNFDKGTAFYHHKIERSSFIYARHENDRGTHSMLYYVYRHDSILTPVHISWIILLAIPLLLVLLAYMFKRFIIVAAIIFMIFLYFNHHSNLSVPTFFQSVFDGLKSLF